jgi:hypothetical protein
VIDRDFEERMHLHGCVRTWLLFNVEERERPWPAKRPTERVHELPPGGDASWNHEPWLLRDVGPKTEGGAS